MKLKTVYNKYCKKMGWKDCIGEYDSLLGDLTVEQMMKEFEKAGSPEDPYDIPIDKFNSLTEYSDLEYPVFDAIFDMDTVCRVAFWEVIYK